MSSTGFGAGSRSLLRILLLSVLALFLEMLLVRWIGTEVRVFAYLPNGVLVAAFLGLGLGAREARRPVRLLPAALALLGLALFIKDPFAWDLGAALTQGLTAFQDSMVWAAGGWPDLAQSVRSALVAFALGATAALLWAIATVFRPLGQWLGRWMDEEPRPILAYSANVLGSVAGIAAFTALTAWGTPPALWMGLAVPGLVALAPLARESRGRRVAAAVGFALAPVVALGPAAAPGTETVWSPYQKLELRPWSAPGHGEGPIACGEEIMVNGIFHQEIVDLDPARQAANPERFPPREIRTSHYVLPWELIPGGGRILVAGAGTGNDVASALRAGASAVRAVEIDPAIVRWGREYHPNRPYASPRVEVTIDDAMAFFRRGEGGRFDVVWLGFLDTNIRLDHFVYTRESFQDIRRILSPNGVVVLYFYAEAPWVGDRLAGLLRDAFGAVPVTLVVRPSRGCLGFGGLLLIGGTDAALAPVRRRLDADPALGALRFRGEWPMRTALTTDDWPYLYLRRPSVPTYHLLVGAACLMVGLLLRRRMFQPGEPVDAPMLLLGAGFMLLEVVGVSRGALLYGTTWTVNAYVVGALLCMVLLANLVAARFQVRPEGWPFVGLFAALVVLVLVPADRLASLPGAARILLGAAFLTTPVFFSGLVFVGLWARSARRDLALGSNLLGSLLGGLASLLSMLIGFRGLILLTLAIYLGALLATRAGRGAGVAPAPTGETG
jgi:SAM-dependent methyltransferase